MADNKLEIILSADVDQATKNINAATASIKNLDKAATASKGIDKIGKSAANATPALTNFGRVIQDAPFGIIGIANNIDPLIASFQQLKTQTGSTGGAIKAFVSGLAGPAGIAIAVSAVTSALIAFGPQIAEFLGFAKDSGEAAKKSAEGFTSAANAIAGEASQVETLIAVVKSETATRRQKEQAIIDLNKVGAEYFAGLKLEDGIVKGLDPAYKNYVAGLLAAAKAKAAQTAITDLYTKRIEIEAKIVGDVLTSALNKTAAASAKVDKAFKNQREVGLIGPGLTKDENAAIALNIQITEIDKQIAGIASKTVPAYTKSTKDAAASTTALSTAIKSVPQFQSPSLTQGIGAGVGAAALAEYKLLVASVIAETAKLPPATAIVSTQLAQVLKEQQAILTNISNETKAQLEQQGIDKNVQNATAAFNLLTPAIDQAFNALANGENAFEGVKQALKRLLIDLAKAAALSLILSAITGGVGGVGVNGAKGFLGIFKSLLGGRANGGPVNSGGPYIVGESGPELFVPSSAGQIVPNMALGGGGGQLQAVVSGNDLLFILNQAGQNRRNNFG